MILDVVRRFELLGGIRATSFVLSACVLCKSSLSLPVTATSNLAPLGSLFLNTADFKELNKIFSLVNWRNN